MSPSLASLSSSCASINSTTEWHVTDKGDIPQYPKLPERQHSGWTVCSKEETNGNQDVPTENEDVASSSLPCSASPEPGDIGPTPLNRVPQVVTTTNTLTPAVSSAISSTTASILPGNSPRQSLDLLSIESQISVVSSKEELPNDTQKAISEPNSVGSSPSTLNTSEACSKTITSISHPHNASHVDTSSGRLNDNTISHVLSTPPPVNSETSSSRHSHKKHKKHKRKRHKDGSRHSRHDIENESFDTELIRRKKHKKHKHKKESSTSDERRRELDDGLSSAKRRHRSGHVQDDSAEYEWVERTKEHFRPLDMSIISPTLPSTEVPNDSLTEPRSVEGPVEPPVEQLNTKNADRHLSSNTSEHSSMSVESNCKSSNKLPVQSVVDSNGKSPYSPSKRPNAKLIDCQSKSSVYSPKELKPDCTSSEQHTKSLTVTPLEIPSQSHPSNAASTSRTTSFTVNSTPVFSSQKNRLSAPAVDDKISRVADKSELLSSKHSDLSYSSSSDRTMASNPSNGQHKLLSKSEKPRSHYSGEVSRHFKPNVSNLRWDTHIHDGYKRPMKVNDNCKVTWDGSKNSRIADELEKSSHRAYGGQMMSWDGGKSVLTQDLELYERNRNKRYSNQDYNDDFDRGKAKKIKKSRLDHLYNNNGINSFQRLHEDRNKDKWRYGQRMSGSTYGQHPYHRPYQNYGRGASMNHIRHYSHYMGRNVYRH